MSRFWKIALPVVLVLVAAGFAGWWFLLRDDAPPEARLVARDAPAATTAGTTTATSTGTTGSPAGTTASGATGRGDDRRSGRRIARRHLDRAAGRRGLRRLPRDRAVRRGDHREDRGRPVPAVTGTVVVAAEGQGATIPSASVEVDMTQLTSDSEPPRQPPPQRRPGDRRVPHGDLRAHPADRARRRTRARRAVRRPGDREPHAPRRHEGGHDPLSVRWSGEFIDVAGQLPIVLADYQIDPPNVGGFVSVAEDGILELQLSFVPA